MKVYNITEFSDYIKNTEYKIDESYNTNQKLDFLTTYYANDELNKINYSTAVSLYNNASFSLIKTEYAEASNLTAEEMNKKIYEEIINKILGNFKGLNGEEKITEGKDNYYYHLTTLENELNQGGKTNKTHQFSRIDLGECEDVLKEKNNLNENTSLIILKYEKISNISSERDLQYEIYEPINKTRLDLSVCKDIQIDIYIPVILSEKLQDLYNELKDLGYDLFDINSNFYQDICTPYKSQNGTDVLLSDRIDYYFNNDETQCQPNCQFSDYSLETQDLKCECNIVSSEINVEKKQEIGSKSIYKSFYDVLKFSNYKVLKCYKLAFCKDIFINNKGNIMVIIFFGIYFITLLLYIIKGKAELKTDLSKIISNNKPKDIFDAPKFDINNKIIKIENKSEIKNNISSIKNLKVKELKNNIKIIQKNNNKKSIMRKDIKPRRPKPKIIFDFPPKKILYHVNNFRNYEDISLSSNKFGKTSSKNIIIDKGINDTQNMKKEENEIFPSTKDEKLDNYELNNLEYNMALNLDKRKFLEIYWSLLKREHLIIFSFFIRNDHNIIYIKYSRFIFLVCTDMALNVFFFSDETMHKMFLDYGKYNFFQQIPQIIYSTIVSQLIELLLCYLSLTDKYYYQIKGLNIKTSYQILRIIKCMQLKIYFFFIFTGIMFFFYWYTITCFCSVYVNTQTAFIKDSFISFALGLLYPFGLYLIPSILRIIALSFCKGKLSFIFKMSDIIPCF